MNDSYLILICWWYDAKEEMKKREAFIKLIKHSLNSTDRNCLAWFGCRISAARSTGLVALSDRKMLMYYVKLVPPKKKEKLG